MAARKPKKIRRRNRFGQFSSRGQFTISRGKLVRIPKSQPRRPSRPPTPTRARRAARRAARDDEYPIPAPDLVNIARGRTGAKYFTWFRAEGTLGPYEDLMGDASPDLTGEPVEEFPGPHSWYSTQYMSVKYRGQIALKTLVDRLNSQLQFLGAEERGFDFRRDYPNWRYSWQVTEHIGPEDKKGLILIRIRDSRPKRWKEPNRR